MTDENTNSEKVQYKATIGTEAEDFRDLLPPEHYGQVTTAPVVAFAHTVMKNADGSTDLHLRPIAPTVRCCGYSIHLEPGEKVDTITQALPGGLMHVLVIKGPGGLVNNMDLGIHYPGTTPVDFQARAMTACERYTEAFQEVVSGATDNDAAELLELLKGEDIPEGLLEAVRKAADGNSGLFIKQGPTVILHGKKKDR